MLETYKIIPYDEKYRDDMIFMVLQAKDALGRIPGLNEDLLDVKKNYLDVGDMFWLAIDEKNRVIGCVGYHAIPNTTEVRLHRLYVKAARKHQGIGTRLLHTAEQYLQEQGKTVVHVHLGGKEYFESRSFYPKHGYQAYDGDMMKKEISRNFHE
jgi:N-acetylglutamate synthase-like GNAT family acetyltransferase